MNDIEFELNKENREKKNIGRNSKYMNRTGKGPIRFPSDYLSNKEKKKLNGPVISYDMGRPMTYANFRSMPQDLQKNYLDGIIEKFKPTIKNLSELFGISESTMYSRIKMLGVTPAGTKGVRNTDFNEKAWDEWIADGKIPETKNEYEPKETVAPLKHEGGVVIPDVMPVKQVRDNVYAPESDVIEVEEFPKVGENAIREVGLPNVDFIMVAQMWDVYLASFKSSNRSLTPKDVAAMFAITKFADITAGKATSETWKDLAMYAMRASEL